MGNIVPDLSSSELAALPSRAEARLYEALRRQLPQEFKVLYSVRWILRNARGRMQDGEADFLVCTKDGGLLVIEVKGGGIHHDPACRSWTSIDALGRQNSIKDPFAQALVAKYAIRAKLREHPDWSPGLEPVPFGHAVFFPDLKDVMPLCMPHSPKAIMGGQRDLDDMRSWINGAFVFWADRRTTSHRPGPRLVPKQAYFGRPDGWQKVGLLCACRLRLPALAA